MKLLTDYTFSVKPTELLNEICKLCDLAKEKGVDLGELKRVALCCTDNTAPLKAVYDTYYDTQGCVKAEFATTADYLLFIGRRVYLLEKCSRE